VNDFFFWPLSSEKKSHRRQKSGIKSSDILPQMLINKKQQLRKSLSLDKGPFPNATLTPTSSTSNLPSTNANNNSNNTTELGDAPKAITKRVGPVFFFTNQTAAKYQEYQVVKINKFGVRQERY
jgi:hypothetical protein